MPEPKTLIASCLCGGLSARVNGAPRDVYVCACRNCQKKSGSAFTYAAIFKAEAVSVAGAHKQYRYNGDSGRWIENNFCPTCGGFVFFTAQGFPDFIGINVGALDDQDFAAPRRMFWSSSGDSAGGCGGGGAAVSVYPSHAEVGCSRLRPTKHGASWKHPICAWGRVVAEGARVGV